MTTCSTLSSYLFRLLHSHGIAICHTVASTRVAALGWRIAIARLAAERGPRMRHFRATQGAAPKKSSCTKTENNGKNFVHYHVPKERNFFRELEKGERVTSCMSKELLDSSSVQTPHYLSWSMTFAPPHVPTNPPRPRKSTTRREEEERS